jgi:hypothetical protein
MTQLPLLLNFGHMNVDYRTDLDAQEGDALKLKDIQH